MYSQALESLQKANALMEDPVIYDHLGDAYIKMNKIQEAIKYWQLSLELNPDQQDVEKKLEEIKSRGLDNQVSVSN